MTNNNELASAKLQSRIEKAKAKASGGRDNFLNTPNALKTNAAKDNDENSDIRIGAGIAIRTSTKKMLIMATEIYQVRSQSTLAENILRTSLAQLLEKKGVDWKAVMIEDGLMSEDEVD